MNLKTRILYTKTFDPWWNLAVEEYLLDSVQKDQCILYLWQNQNTVVIGKNQNAWRECRTKLLEKEGGKLARRISGGGAVFHDIGNLNFTFLMNRENYDFEKQAGVILTAVQKLGIAAEMTGRNDLTIEGRKFSGNAFCFRKSNAYHHGTILVSVDINKLTRYLQVSEEKIKSKGIQSIRSRVVNLTEYKPALTIDEVAYAVMEAFKETYGGNPPITDDTDWMNGTALEELYKKYASWEWRYGEAPKFDIDLSTRFPWGGIEVGLQLVKGKIKKAYVYSDAMDEELISTIPQVLEGCIFESATLAKSIRSLEVEGERKQIMEDIADWLYNKGF
ncbi:MAG: lipoate---protein ligase [Clostridiales bacterium]|jgi:lipoate-protein ligase A|nr:lipoate---protein ligase [Clostridiales bacterium]